MDRARRLAQLALELEAFKFSPADPFTWASGYRMPVYNDNRLLLSRPEARRLVAEGFAQLIHERGIACDVVAGVATSGIPHATCLADLLGKPLVYVRDKPKDHGLRNRIEGVGADQGLEGRQCVVIEDLISTGGSSARAVAAVREAGGRAAHCLAIFSYGFPEGRAAFQCLKPPCQLHTLLEFPLLLETARQGALTQDQAAALEAWSRDPWGWGAAQGFPKMEKK
jgi:orotate phosphoribosyltransferase